MSTQELVWNIFAVLYMTALAAVLIGLRVWLEVRRK